MLLFDSNPAIGRKLLVTGNGRCNLTNSLVAPERYSCADRSFLSLALEKFGRESLLSLLRAMGVLTFATHDGWYYPVSNSAVTVQKAFEAALQNVGVQLHLKTTISDIHLLTPGFLLETEAPPRTFGVDRLIVAAGGSAYPALGSRGECFPILERLGHTVVPPRPALAPIRADVRPYHALQGVRLDVRLALYEGEDKLGETAGNLLFTEFGFSGPAAMDLSHLVQAGPGKTPQRLVINLIPTHLDWLRQFIAARRDDPLPLSIALGSVLPPKMPPVFIAQAGLPDSVCLNQVSDHQLEVLLRRLTAVTVEVRGTRGFQFSQLSAGGVPVSEVDPNTMESRRVRGLYLVGEVLDVVGPCGGFNLQFAFTSGAVAGMAVGDP